MTSEEHGDGHGPQAVDSEAGDPAALVLVESLIHVLVERSVLALPDAMSAVQTAIDVMTGVSRDDVVADPTMARSADKLFSILDSLAVDADLARPAGRKPPYPPLHSVD